MGFAVVVSSANGFKSPGSKSPVVLVVEDEFLLRCALVEYLRDHGCVVLEARTAEQAVAMCRAGRRVDVVLTDIGLQGSSNGWDVAETLRAAQPEVGVVYVSGNSADRSRRVAGSLFFNKPYRLEDVARACQGLAQTSH
jgi:CheY-like chemotaxis protein